MPLDDAASTRARSFNGIAEAYEAFRPGYPDALLDDVLHFAGDRVEVGVLEVGAGTGKATLPLARRGLSVTAVEPGENMARMLVDRAKREGLADRVMVRVGRFEDLSEGDGPFGLVVAAQSFHWTDPDTRWARLVDLLAPAGAAAMFWNTWVLDPAEHDIEKVRDAYRLHWPNLLRDVGPHEADLWPANEIRSVASLVDSAERSYAWELTLSTSEYLQLLATTSEFAILAAPGPVALFESLGEALGERVRLRGATQLNLMRRSG